jgi:hypothetical protein
VGGAIIIWRENRSGANSDIYAQRVLASGTVAPTWPVNGLAVCGAPNVREFPGDVDAVSDGAGGAIIVWEDYRTASAVHIYAQRVLASGVVDPAWPANGRALCVALNGQGFPTIVTDGAGGAIVTWEDGRTFGNDIYAQHVLATGVVDPAWPTNGRALCTAANNQFRPTITTDGAGGAIVTWYDQRTYNSQSYPDDIYAQHVLASGTIDPAWPVNGRPVCTAVGVQGRPLIVSDGAGGAIITWNDGRSGSGGSGPDIYAQRVLSSGVVDGNWPVDGRALCTAVGSQGASQLVSDSAGGAIVTWQDNRDVHEDIYAQHVLSSGVVDGAWPVDGRALCVSPLSQLAPRIVTDGAGGAIVTWLDYRDFNSDIYAQHVLASGTLDGAWPDQGLGLCTDAAFQRAPAIAADGAGGTLVTWTDPRNGRLDIYAQRADNTGQLGSACGSRNAILTFGRGAGTTSEDAYQSVGAPDGRGTPLGYQGQLVMRFLCDIADGPGFDLRVYELGRSFPASTDENYRVEASTDGVNFSLLGDAAGDITDFDLATAGMASARYVRVTDLPPLEQFGTFDATVVGADIDAILAIHTLTREVDCRDGIDNDGDGLTDCVDGDCHVDADGDLVDALPCGPDCNDRNSMVHPGAAELCGNMTDDDCDAISDCADACSWELMEAQIPDCTLPCSSTHEFCQWFEWVGGAPPNPGLNFDIVIGADKTMSPAFLTDGLTADINLIRAEFEALALDPAAVARISWWRCKQRVLVVRYADETTETAAYLSLLKFYHLDAAAFRSTPLLIPGANKPSLGETKRASPPYAWYAVDPAMDGAVTALHELGHAAFGLADEYGLADCKGLPCSRRSEGYRGDKVAPNVWSSESACNAKRSYYAQCDVTAPCYEFCEQGTAWRLGSDTENANLMRAKCPADDPSRWDPSQGYGQMGNIRVREVLNGYVTPCFGPASVSPMKAVLAEANDAGRVRFRLSFTPDSISAAAIEISSGDAIPVVPTTDPIYVDIEDASGMILADVRPWDPRVSGVHDAVADSGQLVVDVPLPTGARAWSVRDLEGNLLAHGPLDSELLEYCRAINFTDADCWINGGTVAVPPAIASQTIRFLPIWPNPTKGRVLLRLEIPKNAPASVRIFDLTGRRVRTLANGTLQAGTHTLEWDSKDEQDRFVPAGVYFCSAIVGSEKHRRTVIVVR